MVSGDTEETSGTPNSPIRSMASLEQTPPSPSAIIVGETSSERGSVVAVVPSIKQEQPTNKGQSPSTTMPTTGVLAQIPHLLSVPTGARTSVAGDHNVTPTLFKQSLTHSVTATQPVVLQTPPPNHTTIAQPVVFQTPPPLNQMASTQSVAFQTPPPTHTTVAQSVVFQTPPTLCQMAGAQPAVFQTTPPAN